jgi:hypothetical protein
MKTVVAALAAVATTACTPDVNVARYAVQEYRANATLRREIFAKCRNDPGTLGQSADCINAREAELLESRGPLRDHAPLGLRQDPSR